MKLNSNNFNRIIFINLFFIGISPNILADTIYEWTDPWGQIQYSKTPEPGSRISDVTELPQIQETSEQQKKQAMSMKIQKINELNLSRKKKNSTQKILRQQNKIHTIYCSKLRTLLVDTQLKINRAHSAGMGFYGFYHPGNFTNVSYYASQERNLFRELRKNCR